MFTRIISKREVCFHFSSTDQLFLLDYIYLAEFTFESRRHLDYSFGLTLYVKGFIDSRISTCCEYKHRHGVRLGGDRGHFAIISVKGSTPCVKFVFSL